MTTYGQFCPVAKAMELLDERWTLLVVRELLCGSRHFNELRRGVPRMSPALLSKRLRTLGAAGVVERRRTGRQVTYTLTPAGEELRPVIEVLGQWGIRWVPELGDADYDPHLLLWDVHRNLDLDAMPDGRTVLQFTFTDVTGSARHWWLVVHDDTVDICDQDPGHDIAVVVETDLLTLTRLWRGDTSWADALRAGRLVLHGSARTCRALPGWLRLSSFARVPRPDGRPAAQPAGA